MSLSVSWEPAEAPRAESAPVRVMAAEGPARPVILASPHSGRAYPESFVVDSRLDRLTLRRSEDSFVDELVSAGPSFGMPLIAAQFPRVYCDVNREPYELDQQMFDDRLPAFVNTRSVRVACGLGTIARVVSDGAEIYRRRLSFAEAEQRLRQCYRPYHRALKTLIDDSLEHYGTVLVIDCHSMPSVGGPLDQDAGLGRKDIVLGDRYGTSCAPGIVSLVEETFRRHGFDVVRNNPYAGGHTTQLYGKPDRGIQALQIEINRALYMDEKRIERGRGFGELRQRLTEVLSVLARALEPELLQRTSAV